MVTAARLIGILFLGALPGMSALAADIPVEPGADSLARAVAQAAPGDRLLLGAGDYPGRVSLTRRIEIVGSGRSRIVGPGAGSVITIDAPGVVVAGLRISGSGSDHETIDSGVKLTKKATGAVVRENLFEGNLYGIDIHGARNARVEGNRIIGRQDRLVNRRGNGIYVWNAPGTAVIGNHVTFGRDGIFVNSSRRNIFRGNRFEKLRFAIHYMYANDSEVSGNVSVGNHLGYAIMFSSRVRITGNLSVGDRDHGIMLNYANSSLLEDNVVRDGGEKCLFMYNANKNAMRRNRFEGCLVGIHFTAGSERNEIAGNAFVRNRTQVKYVGTRNHDWSGNYWSNHGAYDVNGDGIADQPFRPNDRMDLVLWTQPSARMLLGSPAVQLIRWAQKEFPALLPGGVIDSAPLMQSAAGAAGSVTGEGTSQ
ncbi:MAG: nitrous oxide reductase family maturation protein NosD [Rhodospirillales bacterium]